MLDLEQVRARVAKVAELGRNNKNPEQAHHDEDELHRDVLRSIADGTCEDPIACAKLALETWDLEFPRWYA